MNDGETRSRAHAKRDPLFGDLGRREEMRQNGVKGNLLGSRAWYVKQHFGEDAYEKVARVLPPTSQALFRNAPLPFSWCAFGDMMDIDRAIIEGPMKGDVTLMKPFGSAIAKHDLPTLYKVLFKVGTPEFVMKRIGIAAATYIRESPMKGASLRTGQASVVQTGRLFPLYFCKYGVSGWFQAAVELSGGKGVSVEHTVCRHDGALECQWELAWV